MNEPPTSLVGFGRIVGFRPVLCRLDMNEPPTSLVGFRENHGFSARSVFGLDMNELPTSLVGLQ